MKQVTGDGQAIFKQHTSSSICEQFSHLGYETPLGRVVHSWVTMDKIINSQNMSIFNLRLSRSILICLNDKILGHY